jgi:fucose permease
MQNRRNGATQIGLAYAAFILIGANDGALGVLLPIIQRHYSIDKSVVSLLFLFGTAGYLTAAFSSGPLVERLGTHRFLVLGPAIFLAGAALISVAPPFPLVLSAVLVLSFGVGIIDAGLNTFVARLPNNTSLLNYLHACYGAGALLGPIVASGFLALQWSWNTVYFVWIGSSLLVTLGIEFAFRRAGTPSNEASAAGTASANNDGNAKAEGNVLRATLRLRAAWLAALFLLLYVGAEVSIGNWSYSLLTEDRGVQPLTAGWSVSGFWLGLTLGRLLLGGLAKHVGDKRLIQICLAGVVAGLLLVWLPQLEETAVAGLWLTGFSLGPIFPTTIAILSRIIPPRLLPSAIGFAASTGSVGAALFPWLAGNLAQVLGLWTLMPYVVLLSALMLGFWLFLQAQPSAVPANPK